MVVQVALVAIGKGGDAHCPSRGLGRGIHCSFETGCIGDIVEGLKGLGRGGVGGQRQLLSASKKERREHREHSAAYRLAFVHSGIIATGI